MVAAVVLAVALGGGPEPTTAASSHDRLAAGSPTPLGTAASRSHVSWSATQASYYEPTGNATSCGYPMTWASWHVAALKRSSYRCGDRIVICNRAARVCATVVVKDRGAWRIDNRRWDLTPRVRAALRCNDLCNVHWRKVGAR